MRHQWNNSKTIIQLEFYLTFDLFIALLFCSSSLNLSVKKKRMKCAWGCQRMSSCYDRFFICLSGNLIAFIVWCWNYSVVGWWCDWTEKRKATKERKWTIVSAQYVYFVTEFFFSFHSKRKENKKLVIIRRKWCGDAHTHTYQWWTQKIEILRMKKETEN